MGKTESGFLDGKREAGSGKRFFGQQTEFLAGKRVSLFGYGLTTKAIAKRYGPFTFYDDNVHKPFVDAEGNRVRPSADFDPRYSDIEIPSPGIPPSHPLIRKANNLVSEYDLFLSPSTHPPIHPSTHLPIHSSTQKPFTVWITGTNGKTTTTQMITHLLADKGALSGGNIGTPLADLDPEAPLWILETSSFALHYTQNAKPDIYLVLPVTPDHISWHGGEDAYIADKLSPLPRMREGEAVILPAAFADAPTHGFKIPYDTTKDLAACFGIETAKIRFEGAFLFDAVMAMAVDKMLYDRLDYDRINAFELDPHRQEELHDARGRLWVNDTKATNIDAALAALERYGDRPVHLIVGGDDKGVDLVPLFDALKHYDITLYTVGTNAERLDVLSEKYGFPFRHCETVENAVDAISRVHTKESVALLSPAAASLDQFPSYAARGEAFKKAVRALS